MRTSLWSVVILSALLVACGGKRPQNVTEQSVQRLRQGMNFYEVQNILGSPTEDVIRGADRSCTWNGERMMVIVDFHNDRARTIAAIERQKQPSP